MKIRIYGNSVRIRISKSELSEFTLHGILEEKTNFGGSALSYILQKNKEIITLDATFANGTITMSVPENQAQEWADTEKVGLSHYKDLEGSERLFILLEKDFKCIDNTGMEDQSDNFENPLHVC